MVIQNNYFDLFDIFVNELIGDIWLAIFIGIIVIVLIAVNKKMPYQLTVLLVVLWLSIVFAATFLEILWVGAIMAVGVLLYYRLKVALEGR